MPGFKGWFLVEALDHQPCVLVMKTASICGGKKKKKLQPKLRETHSIDNELAFNCPSLCYQGKSNAHYSEQHRAREDPSQQRLLRLCVDTTTDLLHVWLPCKVREQRANSALLLSRGEGNRG